MSLSLMHLVQAQSSCHSTIFDIQMYIHIYRQACMCVHMLIKIPERVKSHAYTHMYTGMQICACVHMHV